MRIFPVALYGLDFVANDDDGIEINALDSLTAIKWGEGMWGTPVGNFFRQIMKS